MEITEQELFDVPVPLATDTYAPVSHKEIVTNTLDTLSSYGLGVRNKTYRANSAGTQLIGTFDLNRGSRELGIAYRLTFRNSYDKTMAVSFFAGAVVLVCSNGMMLPMTGEGGSFRRKHTGSVAGELKMKIEDAIGKFGPILNRTFEHAEAMQKIQVDKTAAAELCGRLFVEQEVINSTQLNIVKRELDAPSYEAFTQPNLWSFYNHVTHALKKTHPTSYVEQHLKLHSFVESAYGL